ncbi:MAG: hypothetical protein N3I86_02335 [Verrucomicrobiae bacterium]|nr:hypothetical protein [Verrucomicrobiae bacterium]MDW8310523.1 hypothetical protein [Verrucomicrobiales bacterium]
MSELLNRFSFDAAKFNAQTALCMLIIWLMVLGCAIWSIRSQSFTSRQRWFWILTVVCLPGIGVLFYLPFSLGKDRLPAFYRADKRSKNR